MQRNNGRIFLVIMPVWWSIKPPIDSGRGFRGFVFFTTHSRGVIDTHSVKDPRTVSLDLCTGRSTEQNITISPCILTPKNTSDERTGPDLVFMPSLGIKKKKQKKSVCFKFFFNLICTLSSASLFFFKFIWKNENSSSFKKKKNNQYLPNTIPLFFFLMGTGKTGSLREKFLTLLARLFSCCKPYETNESTNK